MISHKNVANHYSIDRLILLFMTALVVVVPLTYSSNVTEITLYPKFLVLTVIVSILTVLWLIKLISQKKSLSFSTPLTLPILFFLLINIASLSAAINVYAALFPLAQLFTLNILFFILYNNLTSKRIHLILKAWAVTGAIVAIIGIGQYLGWGFYWIPSAGNPSSTFAYRNMAAMFLILTLPVAGFLFLTTRRINSEIVWGFVITLLTVYLIYTRTRGAWVGLIVALIISFICILWLRRTRGDLFSDLKKTIQSKSKGITALACIVVIAFMASLEPNIKEVSSFGEQKSEIMTTAISILKEGGDSGRLGIWRASLDMFKDNLNWLSGVGLNNWHFNYPYYAKGHLISTRAAPFRPHNDFLWILTETGVVGFSIYIWLLLTVAYMVFRILKYSPDAKTVLLTVSLTTSLAAILSHAMFSFPKERIASSMLFWIILAFIAHIYRNATRSLPNNKGIRIDNEPKSLAQTNYRLGIFALILFVIISGTSVELARRHLLSDHYYLRAQIFYLNEDYPNVINELIKAEDYYFHNWRTAHLLGTGYLRLVEYSSAISNFERCLTYSPHYINTRYNLGITYFRNGDYINAIIQFTIYNSLDPTSAKAYYRLAISWHAIGNVVEAEKN
ncbi:MAG: O-antigen ligase family protein, partial [Candidatus Marinimicrobia bacterium]|nr:O-antigen ligase family protein [Candidatus Neomarinimicrobiota bacterium]